MLSVAEDIPFGSQNHSLAVYKGQKVAVYPVNKTELSLTRRDLVELITVRIFFYSEFCIYLCIYSLFFMKVISFGA